MNNIAFPNFKASVAHSNNADIGLYFSWKEIWDWLLRAPLFLFWQFLYTFNACNARFTYENGNTEVGFFYFFILEARTKTGAHHFRNFIIFLIDIMPCFFPIAIKGNSVDNVCSCRCFEVDVYSLACEPYFIIISPFYMLPLFHHVINHNPSRHNSYLMCQ